MKHTLTEGLVVPYGCVTCQLGKKGEREYQQGQYMPKGSIVLSCSPEALADDLGFTKPKAKAPAEARTDTTKGG